MMYKIPPLKCYAFHKQIEILLKTENFPMLNK